MLNRNRIVQPAPTKCQVLISSELHQRLKRYAEQQCTTVEAVVEAMLSDIGKGD